MNRHFPDRLLGSCFKRRSACVVVAALLMAFIGSVSAQDNVSRNPNDEAEPGFLCVDHFNGQLNLNWQPVRPDPTRISITKRPGYLTITAQRGTIHRDLPPTAKNLFVLDNPLAANTDFAMTTRLSGFEPSEAFQQAGVIAYDDDDNYLKWIVQFNWREGRGVALSCLNEEKAVSKSLPVPAPNATKDLWLRLTKRGNAFQYSSSTDGKSFTVHGETIWRDGAPKKLGLVAKTGGDEGVPEIDAHFDFFELRPLVNEDKSKSISNGTK